MDLELARCLHGNVHKAINHYVAVCCLHKRLLTDARLLHTQTSYWGSLVPTILYLVQGFAVVVKNGLTKEACDATVGLHPTSAEEFVLMTEPDRRFRDGKLWLSQDQ